MRAILPFLALALAGCVSDDGTAPSDAGPDTSADVAVDAAEAPPDVSLVCPTGTGDCQPDVPGCETSLLSSDANCGACGHDCGGTGLCSQGVCQPLVIAKNVPSPVSLAVAGTSVFWMVNQEVQRCPVGGCTGNAGDVGDGVNVPKSPTPYMITADANDVYWVGYTSDFTSNSIFTCSDSGCGGLPPSVFYGADRSVELVANTANFYWLDGFDGAVTRIARASKTTAQLNLSGASGAIDLQHVAADDAHVLITFGDAPVNGGGLYVCDAKSDCAAGLTRLLDTAQFVADNGVQAVVNQPQPGAIVACDLGGCSGSGTPLANGEKGVSAMIADANDVYWAIKGSGTAADGTIRACALPSCAGGPRTIASNQAAPVALAQDTDFVYWADAGNGTANSGSIVRVRKN